MYLIDEDELRKWYAKKAELASTMTFDEQVNYFLLDKKPVTEIAALTLTPLELLSNDFTKRFEKYLLKDIKIFIQVKE